MPTDATMRGDYVERRVMVWLNTLSLTGSPDIYHANTPRLADPSTNPAPFIRASFRPLVPLRAGRWDATRSQLRNATLLALDVYWTDGEDGGTDAVVYTPPAVAELQNALQYLTLSFLDYSTPASPVTVSDAYIKITLPVQPMNLPPERPYVRWQLRSTLEWVGRVENSFA